MMWIAVVAGVLLASALAYLLAWSWYVKRSELKLDEILRRG